MLNATTHIKRTIVLAGTVIAIAAPSASARPADAQHIPAPASASQSHDAETTATSPSLATLAADREAKAAKNWQTANPATVIDVSQPDDNGFDLASAGIGAAIALTLIMAEAGGMWAVRRRRAKQVRRQLA